MFRRGGDVVYAHCASLQQRYLCYFFRFVQHITFVLFDSIYFTFSLALFQPLYCVACVNDSNLNNVIVRKGRKQRSFWSINVSAGNYCRIREGSLYNTYRVNFSPRNILCVASMWLLKNGFLLKLIFIFYLNIEEQVLQMGMFQEIFLFGHTLYYWMSRKILLWQFLDWY